MHHLVYDLSINDEIIPLVLRPPSQSFECSQNDGLTTIINAYSDNDDQKQYDDIVEIARTIFDQSQIDEQVIYPSLYLLHTFKRIALLRFTLQDTKVHFIMEKSWHAFSQIMACFWLKHYMDLKNPCLLFENPCLDLKKACETSCLVMHGLVTELMNKTLINGLTY